MQKKPILTVFAGPNGSGKSTVTSKYPLPEYYVNADEIERQCNCTQLEAARIAENTREYLLAQKESFAFETVLSTDRNINLIRRAKAAGYYIVVVFITTNNPSINIRRVQARIAAGGNKVDLEKIEPRYWRALRNIKAVYPYCDEFTLWDNSDERGSSGPDCIAEYYSGNVQPRIHPTRNWTAKKIRELFSRT